MKLDPERWNRMRAVLDAVMDLPQAQRAAQIKESCADDEELRVEVEAMLALESKAQEFIRVPTKTAAGMESSSQGSGLAAGTQVGPYTIEAVIGSGGTSVVYRASQENPDRLVALKMLRPSLATQETLQRFQFEVELLGRLSHPHVAHVYSSGLWEEGSTRLPWFALEHIPGGLSITQFAKQKDLSLEQRLALFRDVCAAVHHGHQKGIVHRDLKPTNLLVTEQGLVKVIDFGIARLSNTGDSLELTRTGQMLGTLAYMAPEQYDGDPADVDVRTDVYALGVVLYELLAQSLPLNLTDTKIHEVARRVRETPPVPLRQAQPNMPKELEWITACCLSKDANRRYASASELAADVTRFGKHLPLNAGPPSRIYNFTQFTRRNRKTVVAACLLVALLIGWGTTGNILLARAQTSDVAKTQALKLKDLALDDKSQALIEKAEALTEKTHALQEKQQALVHAERRLAALGRFKRFFDETLFSVSPEHSGRDVLLVEALYNSAGVLAREEGMLPDVGFELHESLGSAFYGLGEFPEACNHFQRALAFAPECIDVSDLAQANLRLELGDAYIEASELEAAEQEARTVLAAETDPASQISMRASTLLAWALVKRNAFDEAEEVLRPYATVENSMPVQILTGSIQTMRLLGKGQLAEAQELGESVLDDVRAFHGAEHPQVIEAMERLGQVLVSQRKHDEAMGYLRDAYDLRMQLYGPASPLTWRSASNLSVVLGYLGQNVERESLLRENLPRIREEFGASSRDALDASTNLASCLSATKRFDEALDLYVEILDLTMEEYGQRSPEYLLCLNNLAFTHRRAGNLEDAAEYYGELNEWLDEVFEPSHFLATTFRLNHGQVLVSLGRFEEAEPILEIALEHFHSSQGPNGRQVRVIEDLLQKIEAGLEVGTK